MNYPCKCVLLLCFLIISASGQTLTPAVFDKTLQPNGTANETKHLHLPAYVTPAMADVLFALDLTGSMGGELKNAKDNAISIMNQIKTLIPDSRFGVVSHMDYDNYADDYPYRLDHPVSDDILSVSSAINSLKLGNGGDTPESYLRVFYESYSDSSINWRNGSKRIIVFWADANAQNPDRGRDGIPSTSDDLYLSTVIPEMAAQNIVLIGLHSGSYLGQWKNYANPTGGDAFQINNDGTVPGDINIAEYITSLISITVKKINKLELAVCTPGYESWLQSVTPAYINDILLDTDVDTSFTLTFKVPSTATPGTHHFKVCAIGDGAEYASQDVNITVPDGDSIPTADAGPDQTLFVGNDCSVIATLDGSGSFSPTGNIKSWAWKIPSEPIHYDTNPSITLSPGIYDIELIVVNDKNESDTDTVVITVLDTTSPVITVPADTIVLIRANDSTCQITTDSAVASDNCTVRSISATRSDSKTFGSVFGPGLTTITWIATDVSGNSDTVIQKITVNKNRLPVITAPTDTVLSEGERLNLKVAATDPDGTTPVIFAISTPDWVSIFKNSDNTYTIELTPGCMDHGNHQIDLIATDSIDTAQAVLYVIVNDVNFPPVFDTLPFERKINEGVPFELNVSVQDCDGTIPSIRMLTSVTGATFTDNLNSTGTLSWTPGADAYGYYMYIFEATDSVNSPVRDTIIIEVIDQNVSVPVLTVTTIDTISSINLPLVIVAHATDADGTVPVLKAAQLPANATFTTDNNGNAVFSWTPIDTGTFTFKIKAFDQADSLSCDSQTVTIRVNNSNITGPKFEPHPDITIQQNEYMVLNLKAADPDGTIPTLRLTSAPSGSRFIDNGNGTATVSWSPSCDVSGSFLFRATATDGKFGDTIEILVHVRDVNCTPVFFRAEDINAQPGERVSIPVRAYDPDNNGSIPVLSVNSKLPDYSFVTQNNGSAVFNWTVSYTDGTYPVTFYATDGNSTDSMKVVISINKTGSLKISARPSGCKIYAFPSDCYKGKLIGADSTVYCGTPGTCWFEFQAPGCRSQRVAFDIKADSAATLSIDLKPIIPLMVTAADTLKCGSSSQISCKGSISFADLNRDHIPDLSIATTSGIICYYGIDSTDNTLFSPVADTFYSGTLEPSLHHTFIHWNNNPNLSCILSTNTGKILLINLKTRTAETLISISGSRLYPTIFDANGDGKKDIIVVDAGKALFVYLNSESDSVPALAFAKECTTPDGVSLTGLNGAALLLDTDMDGKEEMIAFSEGKLKLFKPDSTFSTLSYIENLSCGGRLVTADSMSSSFIGSTRGISSFAIRSDNHILVYPTHLQGDITFDGKVDIHDMSKASKNWEMTPDNQAWDHSINVKLSETGTEKIDIRDISRISKNWELEQ